MRGFGGNGGRTYLSSVSSESPFSTPDTSCVDLKRTAFVSSVSLDPFEALVYGNSCVMKKTGNASPLTWKRQDETKETRNVTTRSTQGSRLNTTSTLSTAFIKDLRKTRSGPATSHSCVSSLM